MEEFKNEKYYISEEVDNYNEWKWYKKKKKQPKRGQYLITEDKEKYDILDVVVYTNEFTMINDYGKGYGKKRSIDETNYDMCFWNRLSDDKDCHITFLICCNKSKQ